MALSARTYAQLQAQGINSVYDLQEWVDSEWKQFAKTCSSPPQVQDPNQAAGILLNQAPFDLSVKSLKRLKSASHYMRYLVTTGREPTPANMQWTTVLQNFDVEWVSILERADENAPTPPAHSSKEDPMQFVERFKVFLGSKTGARKIKLKYLTRALIVPAAAPPLLAGQPYSAETGSVEEELVQRATHTHALTRVDKATMFTDLEKSVGRTALATTIKPFERNGDGPGALLAIEAQHAGKTKHVQKIEEAERVFQTTKWNGMTSIPLGFVVQQIRDARIDMEAAAEHVPHQLPNQHTMVRTLMRITESCTDPMICAGRAYILNEANGIHDNFEAAVNHILPFCPVAKKFPNSKRKSAHISGVGADIEKLLGPKTGVEVRWYKPAEWRKLSEGEQDEVRELRPPPTGGKGGGRGKWKGKGGKGHGSGKGGGQGNQFGKSFNKKLKGKIASLVQKEAKKQRTKEEAEAGELREIASILTNFAGGHAKQTPNTNGKSTQAAVGAVQGVEPDAKTSAAIVKLNSIMKKRQGSS